MAQFQPARFDDGKALLLAGLHEHYTPDTMDRIPAQWERFRPYMGNVSGQVGQATYGVCHNVAEGEFDYLTGVEVSVGSGLPDELQQLQIPAQRYAVFVHTEHISTIKNTIEAIGTEWLPAAAYVSTGTPAFFERYENYNPETGTGDIEIWVPVIPR